MGVRSSAGVAVYDAVVIGAGAAYYAPTLLYALIQRSAWKEDSPKFACRILHASILYDENQPVDAIRHLSAITK